MERKGLRNGQFMDEYGVIYSKNGTKLIKSTNLELESYTIREGCKVINHEAFEWNKNLKEINIPNSVTTIGVLAFGHCENLTNVTIPNGVTWIKSGTFAYCTNLTNIDIPESLKDLGPGIFYKCTSLKSINVDGNNKHYVSIDGVFFVTYKREKHYLLVTYPPSKEETSYIIPDGVKYIFHYAFDSCINLKTITIPITVTDIEKYNFEDCPNLEKIIVPKGTKTKFKKLLPPKLRGLLCIGD